MTERIFPERGASVCRALVLGCIASNGVRDPVPLEVRPHLGATKRGWL